MDHGADLNLTDRQGRTPAHFACFNGHVRCLRLLIVRGADINKKAIDGYTPLDIARINDQFQCVELLLENNGTGLPVEDIPSLTDEQREQRAKREQQKRVAEIKTPRCCYPPCNASADEVEVPHLRKCPKCERK